MDYEIIECVNSESFRQWLDGNHPSTKGIWLKIYKKDSGLPTVTYAEALDIALCYGWIDGQRKTHDSQSFLQKYTPRRSRSLWSKRNVDYIQRLIEEGRMMPAGLAEVERAKSDGRWDSAYDGPAAMTIPDDFMIELEKHPKAKAVFEAMTKSAKYTIGWQLQTAKKEATRQARMQKIIEQLNT